MAKLLRLTVALLVAVPLAIATLSPPLLSAASPTLHRMNADTPAPVGARKARKSRKRAGVPVLSPTLVRDLRLKSTSDSTRLVLDLQRNVIFTQSRLNNPDRVIIELQNSRLSETARSKITDKTFPSKIAIRQPHPRSVTVTLNLDTISDYKLLPLNRPARLVVDLFNRMDGDVVPTATVSSPPPAASIPAIRSAQRPAKEEVSLIVVDPGHGGKDPGAIGRGGTAEKDITLQVGFRLRDLIARQLGKQVLMTRDRDVFVELEDRAKFANSKDADLFVSIHVNSHPQRATKGLEVYHFGEASDRRALAVAARENGTPIEDTGVGWQYLVADLLTTKKVQESLELAWSTKQAMVAHLNDHYDVVDHGVKTAPFYVLLHTAMPSILAEIAFITNPTEERLMQSDAFLTRMAEAIFQGVKAYVYPLQTAKR
ncbi:MAG: N-acetylmuramoyl-L-alanine amidase [Nitrospirae bacterium]|nr:N-acetylmuramoyl-L-alanine amidase [Nitrospirota bacterium]